jgi:hypothetical protein
MKILWVERNVLVALGRVIHTLQGNLLFGLVTYVI